LVEAIIESKQAEGCSNATVNRHLALLRAILRRCVCDWEWLDRAPTIRLLKEPTRRVRFLSQCQALTLLRELPPHLRDMASFALGTDLRAANVTGLIWDQVDLSRKLAWVHPDQAKARKAIAVPLNEMAMCVIEGQPGKHPVHVFSYLGEPIKQVSTRAWYRARKRGGWETERMVRRYAHLAADHLAAYVGNAQIHGTFLAHQLKLPKRLDENVLKAQ
jgi:integrase